MIIAYRRSKQKGVPKTYHMHITGDLEVGIVKRYKALFAVGDDGVFLRKLSWTKECGLKATLAPMGKNTVAEAGRRCAIYIGLESPKSYTGHCWRRAAATRLAEKGVTLAEIKLVTGT